MNGGSARPHRIRQVTHLVEVYVNRAWHGLSPEQNVRCVSVEVSFEDEFVVDGVLRYEDDLAARIDAEASIPSGSAEEVEIRACAVCYEFPIDSAHQIMYTRSVARVVEAAGL